MLLVLKTYQLPLAASAALSAGGGRILPEANRAISYWVGLQLASTKISSGQMIPGMGTMGTPPNPKN